MRLMLQWSRVEDVQAGSATRAVGTQICEAGDNDQLMSGVFISYRRDDTAGHAGRLFDHLQRAFGADGVFMDLDDIGRGDTFAEILTTKLRESDVLIAVVGRRWLTLTDAAGRRRLDADDDWVREEIRTAGGQVSVLEASAVDGYTDQELVDQFRRLRTADYEALSKAIRDVGRKDPKLERRAAEVGRLLRGMRERFGAIQARDYFGAPGRDLVEEALNEAMRAAAAGTNARQAARTLRAKDFRGRTWITRPRPGIDRFASAWCIRRFVDVKAKFGFLFFRSLSA